MAKTNAFSLKQFVLALLVVLALAGPAAAHRVTVFAWVEGDLLIAEAKFPGSGKAIKSPIRVVDDRERVLAEGQTDDQGRFVCPKPKGVTAVTVVLEAGMGHRAQWTLGAAELGVATAPTGPAAAVDEPARAASAAPAGAVPVGQEQAVSSAQIEAAVAKAVDARLGALIGRLDLIAARQEKIDLQNLLGAIGYILGLMGLAAWWQSRSKGRTP